MNTAFLRRTVFGCLSFTALLLVPLFAQTDSPALSNPDLEKLEAAHGKEVREKVDAPWEAGLQKLNDSYRMALEGATKKAIAQGLLDETLAFRTEATRFAAESNVPETDPAGTDSNIVKLHTYWRGEAARLAKQRAAALLPLIETHLGRLRVLERELTKLLKIDEARAVRARVEALTAKFAPPVGPPAIAAATPPAPVAGTLAAKAGATPVSFGRAVDRADLYCCGDNGLTVYLNNKEVLPTVSRDRASKIRVNLKEGDVIAMRSQDRLDLNSFWLSCIAPTGEFLFETSLAWKAYVPADFAKWWDTKKIKTSQPVITTPENREYVSLVKASAAMTPNYHGAQPISSELKDDQAPRADTFVMYTVTRADLVPKKADPATLIDRSPQGAQFVGKTIRLATAKNGTSGIVVGSEPTIKPYDPAAPADGLFKVAKGAEPGMVMFESEARKGFFLRHEGWRLHLSKGFSKDSLFSIEKPMAGTDGYSISAFVSSSHFIVASESNVLEVPATDRIKEPGSAVFFLEAPRK